MFSTADTIVAIATPPGHGGIGVVRLSGPGSIPIACAMAGRHAFDPRHATLARVRSAAGAIDAVIVTAFPGPHSYTGEDVVEISAHGSPVLLRAIVAEAMRLGARLAEPGEFTYRAFLRGRLDLVQAEAVRDLVESITPVQARAAFDQLEGTLTAEIRAIDAALFDLCARLEASLDFPGEGYHFVDERSAAGEIARVSDRIADLLRDADRGRLIREGVHVVLAGRPNSGKSSLFNRLAGAGRAIVTDVPGTTRDLLTETVDVEGVPVTLVDTAGVRHTPGDAIEAEGIARAAAARSIAAVVVVVLDGSMPLEEDDLILLRDTISVARVVVANKLDLPSVWADDAVPSAVLRVSAVTGEGVEGLSKEILAVMHGGAAERDLPSVTNMRHADLLTRARAALERAADAARAGTPEEFVLADLNEARELMEAVTGARTSDDLLGEIFSKFCIGK